MLSGRRAFQSLWRLPGHSAGLLLCAARGAGLGAAGRGDTGIRCPMSGFRGFGGARALGGLRLVSAGPALPGPGGLLLSQVPGGVGTSDPGVPAWGSGFGGEGKRSNSGSLETPGGSFGGDCRCVRMCVSRVAEPIRPPMPPAPPAPKGIAWVGGCLPGSAAASSSARSCAAPPAPRDGSFLPARRRQQLKEELGARLRARVGGGLKRRPKVSQLQVSLTQAPPTTSPPLAPRGGELSAGPWLFPRSLSWRRTPLFLPQGKVSGPSEK